MAEYNFHIAVRQRTAGGVEDFIDLRIPLFANGLALRRVGGGIRVLGGVDPNTERGCAGVGHDTGEQNQHNETSNTHWHNSKSQSKLLQAEYLLLMRRAETQNAGAAAGIASGPGEP